MQKVKIAEVHPSQAEKKPTVLVDDQGARMSGFDAKLKQLKAGDIIEADLEVKGQYINIKSWKLLEGGAGGAEQASSSPEVIDANFRIAALQVAGRLAAASTIELKDIQTRAIQFYAWLVGSSKPEVHKAKAPAETSKQSIKEQWDGIERDRDPGAIKTLGDLFTACLADFKLQRSEVIKELGYSAQEDIGESPGECYIKIKQTLHPEPEP